MASSRPFPDLTQESFLLLMPQFRGISAEVYPALVEFIDEANCSIKEHIWCAITQKARRAYVAHYLSKLLEQLAESENNPLLGGGTVLSADRIAKEKVGDVEISFRAPNSGQNGSNENNDPTSLEFGTTEYGRQYLALLRSLCLTVTTTGSECFL